MIEAYALFKLPGKKEYTEIRQNDGGVEILSSYNDLSGKKGFVISPFSISNSCPLMIIHSDKMSKHDISSIMPQPSCDGIFTKDKESYTKDFNKFHESLISGRFQKIVLSRCSETKRCGDVTDEDIFLTACSLYPNMFVALVSAPNCGRWLTATPEILIEGQEKEWHTMALAGTMLNNTFEEWSEKNIHEQKIVEEYISECLSLYAETIKINGPYTSQAGNLIHLRSDFTFTLHHPETIGEVIGCLHPTPAVCGLPKEEAREFIKQNEHYQRFYYSGFSGILDTEGDTHLFVSLRCMNITDDKFTLYAGGGLLDASNVDNEWMETEAKMGTMKKCIL